MKQDFILQQKLEGAKARELNGTKKAQAVHDFKITRQLETIRNS